jgi:hypothetical protein
MTFSDEMLAGALDLLDMAWDLVRGSDKRPVADPPVPLVLNPVDRELATAIAARRGISVAAAEDMVRWLRTQHSGLSRETCGS